jgi:hypothetical protein
MPSEYVAELDLLAREAMSNRNAVARQLIAAALKSKREAS